MERLDGRAGHLGQLPRGQEGTDRHGVARVVRSPAGDARRRPGGGGRGEGVNPAVAGEPHDSPAWHFGQLLCGEIQPGRHRVVGVESRPAADARRGPHGLRRRESIDPAVAMERLDGRAGHLGQLPRGQEGAGRHGVARVVCRPAGDARRRPGGGGRGKGFNPAVAGEPHDSPAWHFGQLLCGEIQPGRHRVVGVESRPAADARRGPHGKRL
eukprot:scaffold18922_cov59-Phaeocystis_antarctica.AAC.1